MRHIRISGTESSLVILTIDIKEDIEAIVKKILFSFYTTLVYLKAVATVQGSGYSF